MLKCRPAGIELLRTDVRTLYAGVLAVLRTVLRTPYARGIPGNWGSGVSIG